MNTMVLDSRSTHTDSAGSSYVGLPGTIVGMEDQEAASTTSTLGGAPLSPVLIDDPDEHLRFAAELGRRAWRKRYQDE